MALVLKDRVLESSTSTGTSSFTLSGAETGFQSFSVIGNGNTTYYTIQGKNSDGTLTGEWEVGVGTYDANTLSRDTVLESSNSNSLVSFSVGLKDVFCDLPAEKLTIPTGTSSQLLANDGAGGFSNVTVGSNLTYSAGVLSATGGGGMTYPSAGIANSTGSAWGTSYTTTGTGTVVALSTNPTFYNPTIANYEAWTPSSAPSYVEGLQWYDTTQHCLAYYNDSANSIVHIGQDLQLKVINNTGSTIPNGSPVYITGTSSGQTYPNVALAKADVIATSSVIGLTNGSIANGAIGYVTANGGIDNVNTGTFTVGQVLYLSPYSAGQLMNTIPPTGITVQVGIVSYVNSSTGKIYVKQTTPLSIPASIITGTLGVANGGTGVTTLTGYVKGSGTSAFTASSTIPTSDLSGTITNAQLTNSSITINGTAISLGGSVTTGTVTSVSGTSPISVATGTTTPAISIAQANTTTSGYLTSTDWNTFNSKGAGTVTSVSGTGTVNGLSLSGTVTSSGNITLGGTLDLSSPPTIGNTAPNTGAFTAVTTPSVTASATDLTLSAISTGAVKFSTLGGLQAQISNVASAVNYFQLSGGATGKAVQFQALGSDTNVSLAIQSKNTGAIDLATGSSGVNISNGNTVTAVTRTATGTGYTSAPTVNIAAPTTAGGVQATATVNMQLNSSAGPTITNGGTGYSVSDVLTVVGGTFTTAAQYTVSSVSSGVITGLTATNQGNYTVLPTNPVSVTGGTGSGASFTITNWGIGSTFTITNAGSGYIEQPTITFSGGGGSGASAYAVIGSATTLRSLNGIMSFNTPAGEGLRVSNPAFSTLTDFIEVQGGSNVAGAYLGVGGSTGTASLYASAKGGGSIDFFTNGQGNTKQARVAHTASAVNYVQVTGAATGGGGVISSQGSDGNIPMNIRAKGTFNINLQNGAGNSGLVVNMTSGTTLANYVEVAPKVAGTSPVISALGTDTNIDLALTPKGSGKIAINAPIKELIASTASAATITPTSDTATQYEVTALAVTATIAAPSGTPQDGQKLILRIKDNGTSQTLTWTTTSGAYRAVGNTLPSATTAGKVGYYGCIYNSQDTFWDVVAIAQL